MVTKNKWVYALGAQPAHGRTTITHRVGVYIMIEQRLENDEKYFNTCFKADINNLRRAINDALAYFDSMFTQMDDVSRLELKVILNELLINAVKHGGGRGGDDRYVKAVAGMATDDCAFLIVEDGGEGYDASLVNEICRAARYDGDFSEIEETGRGIFIVKSLSDDFMVNEKGNKVVIIKKLRKSPIG